MYEHDGKDSGGLGRPHVPDGDCPLEANHGALVPWDVFAVGWITAGGGFMSLCQGTLIITKVYMLSETWHTWLTLGGTLEPVQRLWYGAYLLCIGGAMLVGGYALTRRYGYGWWLSCTSYVTLLIVRMCVQGPWDWGETSLVALVLWFILRARRCRAFSRG